MMHNFIPTSKCVCLVEQSTPDWRQNIQMVAMAARVRQDVCTIHTSWRDIARFSSEGDSTEQDKQFRQHDLTHLPPGLP